MFTCKKSVLHGLIILSDVKTWDIEKVQPQATAPAPATADKVLMCPGSDLGRRGKPSATIASILSVVFKVYHFNLRDF